MPSVDEPLFTVHPRDPETGVTDKAMALARGLTALQVVSFLAQGPLETDRLLTFGIQDSEGFVWTGEEFLEDNPVLAVVAAWTAGGTGGRRARQQQLHEWWPNLAMALDALVEANQDRHRRDNGGN